MYRVSVTSSDIRSVGYDQLSGVLEMEFNFGDIYHYFNVPSHLHQALMMASSKGRFFNENIKYNYRYQKVS